VAYLAEEIDKLDRGDRRALISYPLRLRHHPPKRR
jgi:hypothetical protein